MAKVNFANEMERRRSIRFEVRLNCRLQRVGVRQVLDAATLNLGRMGALVVASHDIHPEAIPEPGEEVSLEILLPAHQRFGQRCLACDAVAVRATREESGCYVALHFLHVEIRKVAVARPAAASVAVM